MEVREEERGRPAERERAPAFFSPFFFMMKLDPMKRQEVRARARPLALAGVKEDGSYSIIIIIIISADL